MTVEVSREKKKEGMRQDSDLFPPHYHSPIEKGRKDSLFLNSPFSRKCSGLKTSGVAHSLGSLCNAVRLVRTMIPLKKAAESKDLIKTPT